MTSVKETPLKK